MAASLGVAPLVLAQPSGGAPAGPSITHPYAAHVAEASQRFGIPEAWIWSVMRVESAGNATATSHAGAMGLMQVMPRTYAELRVRYGLGPNAYDPRDSILAGVAYLREMHDRYGSAGFLAAYNAGPGRWEDYVSRRRPLPAETVAYMTRLGPMVGGSAASSPTIVARVDPFAWRRAALFIQVGDRQPDDLAINDPFAAKRQVDGRPDASVEVAVDRRQTDLADPSTARSDELFAVRVPR